MISGLSGATLALLFGYLALFFWGSSLVAQVAGCPSGCLCGPRDVTGSKREIWCRLLSYFETSPKAE